MMHDKQVIMVNLGAPLCLKLLHDHGLQGVPCGNLECAGASRTEPKTQKLQAHHNRSRRYLRNQPKTTGLLQESFRGINQKI